MKYLQRVLGTFQPSWKSCRTALARPKVLLSLVPLPHELSLRLRARS